MIRHSLRLANRQRSLLQRIVAAAGKIAQNFIEMVLTSNGRILIVARLNIVDVYRAVNRLKRKGSLSVRAADNRSQSFSLRRKTAIHTAPLFGKIPSPVSPKTLPSAEAAVGGKGV